MTRSRTRQAAASHPNPLAFPVKVSTAEVERAVARGRRLQHEALRAAFARAFAFLKASPRQRGSGFYRKHQTH
ncbi:hypothetical protein HBA54_20700 [Pelagibius litoralis]|uniref:Uncharacterized protein n=1 Tax=Pelagibius litoralis TaxID=374515 RepID=A0A967K9G1_9PROT|nr:hypothetical protein [Pelagibius litoralis]NIA71023.1 hypothetical protein [Pelagibius litoralis]